MPKVSAVIRLPQRSRGLCGAEPAGHGLRRDVPSEQNHLEAAQRARVEETEDGCAQRHVPLGVQVGMSALGLEDPLETTVDEETRLCRLCQRNEASLRGRCLERRQV